MNHPLPKGMFRSSRVMDRIQSWAVGFKAAGFHYRLHALNRHALDK
jgi:hypothetical protein